MSRVGSFVMSLVLAACGAGEPAAEPGAIVLGPFVDVTDRSALPVLSRPDPRGAVSDGVALVDLDEDGRLDLLVAHHADGLFALRNAGDLSFEPWALGVEADFGGATGLALGDVDGDGRLDVLVTRDDGVTLLWNRGAGVFESATARSGLDAIAGHVSAAVFTDFDGDGRIDLYLGRYDPLTGPDWPSGLPNVLLRGEPASSGPGAFIAVDGAPGSAPGEIGATLAATATDIDGDGASDLVVVNDFGPFVTPNQIYLNRWADQGRFEEAGAALGFDRRMFGMGIATGDVDRDGDIDFYVTNIANNALLLREPSAVADAARERGAAVGHFPDPDPAQPTAPRFPDFGPDSENPTPELVRFFEAYAQPELGQWTLTGWSPLLFDADHDGQLDLFVANGTVGLATLAPEGPGQPNRLLHNRGGHFTEVSFPDVRGATRGAAAGDLDGDGDLDLVWIDNGTDGEPGVRVVDNRSAAGRFVTIALEGRASSRHGIGARIEVTAGATTAIREVRTDTGFASAVPPVAHIGVGDARRVHVRVHWPSGRTTDLPDVEPGRLLTLSEP